MYVKDEFNGQSKSRFPFFSRSFDDEFSFHRILIALMSRAGERVLGKAVEGEGTGHSRVLPEEGGGGHKRWIRRRGGK